MGGGGGGSRWTRKCSIVPQSMIKHLPLPIRRFACCSANRLATRILITNRALGGGGDVVTYYESM